MSYFFYSASYFEIDFKTVKSHSHKVSFPGFPCPCVPFAGAAWWPSESLGANGCPVIPDRSRVSPRAAGARHILLSFSNVEPHPRSAALLRAGGVGGEVEGEAVKRREEAGDVCAVFPLLMSILSILRLLSIFPRSPKGRWAAERHVTPPTPPGFPPPAEHTCLECVWRGTG